MKRMAVILIALVAFGCSSGHTKPTPPTPGVRFVLTPQGVTAIIKNGKEITHNGIFALGACTPFDNRDNVTALGSDGHTMLSITGVCPGAPFRIDYSLNSPNTLDMSIAIGPLPATYMSLSVPMEFRYNAFDTYFTDNGVSGQYGQLMAAGNGNPYGLDVPGSHWAEWHSVDGTVIRVTHNFPIVTFIANPLFNGAETLEPRWRQTDLNKGATLSAHERIEVN